jgi:hypothetical protein
MRFSQSKLNFYCYVRRPFHWETAISSAVISISERLLNILTHEFSKFNNLDLNLNGSPSRYSKPGPKVYETFALPG